MLDGKALTSLCTASGENTAATLGCHAGTEAMALRTFAGVGLIGALHMYILPNCSLEQPQEYITWFVNVNTDFSPFMSSI